MPAAQPASAPADDLEKVVPELDRLIADMRLGTPYGRADLRLADHEERAQRIAAKIIAPFRGNGKRPVNPPRYVSPDGRKAGW